MSLTQIKDDTQRTPEEFERPGLCSCPLVVTAAEALTECRRRSRGRGAGQLLGNLRVHVGGEGRGGVAEDLGDDLGLLQQPLAGANQAACHTVSQTLPDAPGPERAGRTPAGSGLREVGLLGPSQTDRMTCTSLRICECRSRRFWVDCRQDRCRRLG